MKKYELINYSENSEYSKILDMKVLDLQCKHIAYVTQTNKIFLQLAKKVDYQWVVFGSHRFMKEEERLPFEINRINQMAESENSYPVRIVICSNNKIFVDNTHWALAYAKRYGQDLKLKSIPVYIIDFRNEIPTVVDVNNTVIKNDDDILKAIDAASDVEKRIKNNWRPENVSYTLNELSTELQNFAKNELIKI